jgi:signal transduction histidine kinase
MSVRRLPKAALFLVSIVVLAGGLYIIFNQFLLTTGEEIVKAWYYGEVVSLQEGQILPAIAKNQNLFEKSPFIRAVVLIDAKDPGRSLFSVGELSKPISAKLLDLSKRNSEMLTRVRSGFLLQVITARLPGKNDLFIIYEITSSFLIWSYLATVALGVLFVVYLMGVTAQVTRLERRKQEELRTDLLHRLAHDVNSPLLSISNLSLKIKKIDYDIHLRLEQATDSIRRLLSQTDKVDKKMLEETKSSVAAIDQDVSLIPLVATLKEFFIQKRGEFSGIENLEMGFSVGEDCYDKFVRINLDDFKRHLSNVFKNSIEATDGLSQRNIDLSISMRNLEIEIVVSDSGRGIPKVLLPQLGGKGITYGKEEGKGLGLHFAFESVKHWRGEIKVESSEGTGTTILIKLPIFQTPHWYVGTVEPKQNQKLVFIDDDTSMIDRWRSRFQLSDKSFVSFNSADQFRQWFARGGQLEDNLLFIFDYHLDGQNTGLALIDELGIGKESILVTSAYLDEGIVARAKSLSVPIMPKILV